MNELHYKDRVAIVTGAGGGLGKSYALLLGARGAKVVVNDLGGGRHGDGKSSSLADAVVNEIKSKGGQAVADYNSVVEGEKIIKTAIDNFGRIDILINNAGILRDKSFAKISDQDWDLIHAVHVKGAFKTTQAAWEVFKKQKYGRVIMTSSNAALYGNFGQANYSAAKSALVGLTNTLAIEGAKYNINVNVIVPTAASRLTEDILPPDLFQEMKPELIAPVVAYLCHESCKDTGNIIDTALGFAAKVHSVRSQGAILRKTPKDIVTIESVRDNWSSVVNMKEAKRLATISEVTGGMVQSLQNFEEDHKKYGGKYVVTDLFSYNSKDLIVYALGVGASVEDESNLRFLYENHELFNSLPTFFIIPGMLGVLTSDIVQKNLPPGKEANATNILHGEHYLEVLDDLPDTSANLVTKSFLVDLLDKGSGAVAIINSETYAGQNLLFRNQLSIFIVGQGGFNGPRTSKNAIQPVAPPKRPADAVVEQKTSVDQAALYRLSGDFNPLHIDPNMAVATGSKKPILHGLCSLGFSTRHILQKYGGNDPNNFKAVKARFAKTVLPGQTLQTEMWLEGNRVFFQTRVKETNTVAISGAYVDLKSVTHSGPRAEVTSGAALNSDGVFIRIRDAVKTNKAKAKTVNGVFLFNITNEGKTAKQWTLDLKSAYSVYEGTPKDTKADTTLTLSDGDMVELAAGKLNPQAAFMKGKLKVGGNLLLTQKLAPLLKTEAKL